MGDEAAGTVRPEAARHGARYLGPDGAPGRDKVGRAVGFTFDGERLVGREGEPLLAALLAAGMRALRTMPKSGEARGGYCLVGRCPDCLVVVDGRPNVRACVTPLEAGMRVEPQAGLGTPPARATTGGVSRDVDRAVE